MFMVKIDLALSTQKVDYHSKAKGTFLGKTKTFSLIYTYAWKRKTGLLIINSVPFSKVN